MFQCCMTDQRSTGMVNPRQEEEREKNRSSHPSAMDIGGLRVTPFVSSRFRLDGGSMFGVVPRALWAGKAPPDEQNRILLNSNSLLVETSGAMVLVEPGMGSRYEPRQKEIYDLDEMDAVSGLARLGITPERIDIVVPTHLHLDHAGGSTTAAGSKEAFPTFPNARFFIQRAEWEAAAEPHPLEKGSYRSGDYLPIAQAGKLELVEGDVDVAPGLRVELTGGHTRGHQVVRMISGDWEAVFLGDIVPTTAHLRLTWLMAWDLEPTVTYEAKARLLADCARRGVLIFWAHDPKIAACRLREGKPGSYEVDEESAIEVVL